MRSKRLRTFLILFGILIGLQVLYLTALLVSWSEHVISATTAVWLALPYILPAFILGELPCCLLILPIYSVVLAAVVAFGDREVIGATPEDAQS